VTRGERPATRGAHDAVGSGRAGPVLGPRRVRRVTRAATRAVRIAATPVPATARPALGPGAAEELRATEELP